MFGLCGHGNIGFIDALHERSADIKTVSVHHESVAGFMADVVLSGLRKADGDFHLMRPWFSQSAYRARQRLSGFLFRFWP